MTKEERKAYNQAYYENHKENQKAYTKTYYENHKEEKKARAKAWNQAHKENRRARAKIYYKNHKEEKRAYAKKYYQSPEGRAHYALADIRRRARKANAPGSYTMGEWETLKIQYGYTCPSCKKKEPDIKLTVDHIIPLSKGGSNFIENIQPLCKSCNNQKHTKICKYNLNG